MAPKRNRSGSGRHADMINWPIIFTVSMCVEDQHASSTSKALTSEQRGIALSEQDDAATGPCLHVLHEDGMIRAWAERDISKIKAAPDGELLSKEQVDLRIRERPFFRGSVVGRGRYYNDKLEGANLEVWSELDRAWCVCKVISCPRYFDSENYTLAGGHPMISIEYKDGALDMINLDTAVWRIQWEKAEDERARRDQMCMLFIPEAGLWVGRSVGSPVVQLSKQMHAKGSKPAVSLSEQVAVISQDWTKEGGRVQEENVVITLPVEFDAKKAEVDVTFDEHGVVHVRYTAMKSKLK
jgi:hypothetical protein